MREVNDVRIYKEDNNIIIDIVDRHCVLSTYDWEFMKPLIMEIIGDCLRHHSKQGYIHSNELDDIIFKP